MSDADTNPSARLAGTSGRSAGVNGCRSPERGISTSAISASGTCTAKIAFHEIVSVRMPPIAGPAAAPITPAADHTAIARRSLPVAVGSSSSAAQMAAAPPIACTPREASSQPKVGATAQPSEAAANTIRPTRQKAAGARRRARWAAGTATIASTRLNSVSTQATSLMETS